METVVCALAGTLLLGVAAGLCWSVKTVFGHYNAFVWIRPPNRVYKDALALIAWAIVTAVTAIGCYLVAVLDDARLASGVIPFSLGMLWVSRHLFGRLARRINRGP